MPTHKRIVALWAHTCTISCTISTGSSSQFTGMTLNWVSVCFAVETFQFLPWYLHSNRNHCPALPAGILRPGTSGQAAISKENVKGILWQCGSLRLWSHIKTTMDPRKPIRHCERQLFPPLLPFSWTYAYLLLKPYSNHLMPSIWCLEGALIQGSSICFMKCAIYSSKENTGTMILFHSIKWEYFVVIAVFYVWFQDDF